MNQIKSSLVIFLILVISLTLASSGERNRIPAIPPIGVHPNSTKPTPPISLPTSPITPSTPITLPTRPTRPCDPTGEIDKCLCVASCVQQCNQETTPIPPTTKRPRSRRQRSASEEDSSE